MLDKNTIPPVVIEPGIYGEVFINKNGNYYELKHNDTPWHVYNSKNMREYHEQWSGYDLACGHVLLSGFGFGQMATWVASKPEVKSVTVIEKSSDVVTAFLSNNDMPSNITVVIDDASNYSTVKKYDCIIWDHIPNGQHNFDFYKKLCANAKDIKHDLFWFWSLEAYYLIHHYDISVDSLYINPINFKLFDFSTKWEELRTKLDMPTIPSLSKDKVDSYINSYFLRHFIQ